MARFAGAMGFVTGSDMRPIWSLYPSYTTYTCKRFRGKKDVDGRDEPGHDGECFAGLGAHPADFSHHQW